MKSLSLITLIGFLLTISAHAEYLKPGKIAQFKNLVQDSSYQADLFITYHKSGKFQKDRCSLNSSVDQKFIMLDISKDGQVILDKPFGGDSKWNLDECWSATIGIHRKANNGQDSKNDLISLDNYLTSSIFYYGQYISKGDWSYKGQILPNVKKFLNANLTVALTPRIALNIKKTYDGIPFPETIYTYGPMMKYGTKRQPFIHDIDFYYLNEKPFAGSVNYDRFVMSLPASVKTIEFEGITEVHTRIQDSGQNRYCLDLKSQSFDLDHPLPEALSFDLSLDCIPKAEKLSKENQQPE